MLLKTFDKCNVAVVTEYTVWSEERELLDDYVEDYTKPHLENNVLRTMDWMNKGAYVKHVSVNSATGNLTVSVYVKGGEK